VRTLVVPSVARDLGRNVVPSAARDLLFLFVVVAALLGCHGAPPAPTSTTPPPIALNFDHLRHLTLDATVASTPVKVIALYANAPDYRPTGSPQRDGLEGIASVDDAARAAVLYLRVFEQTSDTTTRNIARGLLQFVASMEQGDGEFYNFIDTGGHPNAKAASSRKSMSYWAARSIWALGEAHRVFGPTYPEGLEGLDVPTERAVARLARDVNAGRLIGGSATATSEALLGLLALHEAIPTPERAELAVRTAQLLVPLATGKWNARADSPTSSWHAWGTRSVAALAQASVVLGRPEFLAAAKLEADALWSRFLLAGQVPSEIAANGSTKWFPQIAYGIGPVAEGFVALADATNDRRYAVLGGLSAAWLLGANPAGVAMYDEKTGRTFDGIDAADKVNHNSGAESTIESLLALQIVTHNADAVTYLRYKPVGALSVSLQDIPSQREYTGPDGGRVALRFVGGRLETTDVRAGGPITLTYWPAANPQETRLAMLLTEHWNREHPDIQVRVQPLPAGRSTEEVLLAAIVARATPDVCSNVSSALLSRLVRANGVVRLDNLAPTAARLAERTTAAMLAPLRLPDGGIYSFPWKTNPEMLLYNVGLLSAAGVTPPRNHTELLTAFRKLARDADGDGRLDKWAMWAPLKTTWHERFYDFYPLYLASSGGRTIVSNGKVTFDNPAAVSAVEVLRQGFAQGLLPKANFALGRDPFIDGTVAMKIIGPWFLRELDATKAPGLRYDVSPIPSADGTPPNDAYAFADLRSMAIFSTTKHVDAAAQFVAYLTSPEADRLLIEEASQLPYRRGLAYDARFAASLARSPTLPAYARLVERTRDIDIDTDIVEIFDLLSEAYEASAIYGRVQPKVALNKAATEARKIIDAR
jgi:multiple sugar transport system substrate-binding protein